MFYNYKKFLILRENAYSIMLSEKRKLCIFIVILLENKILYILMENIAMEGL